MKITKLTWALIALLPVFLIGAAASVREPVQVTRACIPEGGEPEQLTISTSAASAELDDFQVYMFICTGATSVYWEITDGEGTPATADSSSNFLPVDTVMYFLTGGAGTTEHISAVDSATTAGTCYLTKCL